MKSRITESEFFGATLNINEKEGSVEIINCAFYNGSDTLILINGQSEVRIRRLLAKDSFAPFEPGVHLVSNRKSDVRDMTLVNIRSPKSGEGPGRPFQIDSGDALSEYLNITKSDVAHISILEIKKTTKSTIKYVNAVGNDARRVGCQYYQNVGSSYLLLSNFVRCASTDSEDLGLMRTVSQNACTLYIKDCIFQSCDAQCMFFGESPMRVESCYSSSFSFKLSVTFGSTFGPTNTYKIHVIPYNELAFKPSHKNKRLNLLLNLMLLQAYSSS